MHSSFSTRSYFTIVLLIFIIHLFGQSGSVAVNKDGSLPDSSAILDIKSTSQGLLIPRLNTIQRDDIINPKVGLEIYNLDLDCFEYYNGNNWLTNCGFLNDPTMSIAGISRTTVNDTVHLTANSPKISENGLWSILQGQGGTFSDITNPVAIFSNNGNFTTYLLRWTISNPCGKTYSDVQIIFNRDGIYVRYNGSDSSGDGSPLKPYQTIQKGMDEAAVQLKNEVYISEGEFDETLNFSNVSNLNVLGGHYAFDWNIRNSNVHKTRIRGGEVACFVSNSSDLLLSGLHLENERSFTSHSICIDVSNSTNVSIENSSITSNDAAPGDDGINGISGVNGQNGGNYNLPSPCSSAQTSTGGQGGAGGVLTEGIAILNGGSGGAGGNGNRNNGPGVNGISGNVGSNNGGSGGSFGPGVGPCENGTCSTGGHGGIASPGADGNDGMDGSGGLGGILGTDGGDGSHGQGGGGGGGGGGCGFSDIFPQCGPRAGNSGSGGGGGGSGAVAGKGGKRGFSSVGIWITNSTLSIVNNTIETAYAGNGGSGGLGFKGGIGGQAGMVSPFNLGYSGPGANGGNGGGSGYGGGGGGGSSICIVQDNASSLSNSSNTFSPGPFGLGGSSPINNGQNGSSESIFTY